MVLVLNPAFGLACGALLSRSPRNRKADFEGEHTFANQIQKALARFETPFLHPFSSFFVIFFVKFAPLLFLRHFRPSFPPTHTSHLLLLQIHNPVFVSYYCEIIVCVCVHVHTCTCTCVRAQTCVYNLSSPFGVTW